jgi:uncharacterized protein (TIGR02147 family)
MARSVGCQTAYISQVILGQAHLSAEQAEKLAQFLKFSEEETGYFLLLVQKDRAGTESLRKHCLKQIKKTQEYRAQLKNRVDTKTELNAEAQAIYFSSWIYSAIHVLTTIPEFQKRNKIAEHLQLPLSAIDEALKFLVSVQLITDDHGVLKPGMARMHLPHDSPLVAKHHANWRLQAVRDLELRNDESLHYSSCVSLSKQDAALIREQLLKTIENIKSQIKKSPEEALYSFCMDLFEI